MAVTFNIRTVVDEAKLVMVDAGAYSFSSIDYDDWATRFTVENTTTYTFQKQLTGSASGAVTERFTCPSVTGSDQYMLLFANEDSGADPTNPPFTGVSGRTYYVSTKGTIRVTGGSHGSDTINVSAVRVDFAEMMAEMFWYLAGRDELMISQTMGSASISAPERSRLVAHSERWRGIK